MSYQVIARKWRPQAFEEVTGQEHVTRTLRNAIEHERLHHAYLFSGARGVGKTTTARLLAKALNCHKTDKPTVSPCRTDAEDICPSCLEIGESRSIDVLEFDAASNTQVEKIRDIILESINIRPARDRNKIFIIDEVHMLSTSSFNALLKTLEEPPPNVVFIMATTELHKVPETITSRCQEFQFRTISRQKIYDRLRLIADAEGVAVSDDALIEIARSGEGSMRDAQSNFDQVISFSADKIEVSDVLNALGMTGTETLVRVARSFVDRDPRVALEAVEELVASGRDLRNFCRGMLSLVRDMMVYKVAPNAADLLDYSIVSREQLAELAGPLSDSDLVRLFNAIADTETQLKDSTQPRYTLELGLVKMTEMRRLAAIEDLLERLGGSIENKGFSAPQAAAAAPVSAPIPATEEKKTSDLADGPAEYPETAPPDDVFDAPPPAFYEEPPDLMPPDDTEPPALASAPAIDPEILSSLPSKLEPLTSAELEHIEDEQMDDAFETALRLEGDTLAPIPNAEELVAMLMGTKTAHAAAGNGGAAGTAAAPARELSRYAPPVFEDKEDLPELKELPADPTEDDLKAYARSKPGVRRTLRLFRAEIIEARQVR